ncbi:MAG: hypothetical protein PHE80_00200 [Candidatus Omnitrophica bacterium]|nr:hypothetical protein [Candidatus Omnitrophota bacterium]MDD5736838.1 hypothetical protein [Candidatus Omnitrophota bacterium]
MLDYDLGGMRSEDGSSLRYEVERRSSDLAINISRSLESTRAYKQISAKVKSGKLPLYFQHLLKREVYRYVREACVIMWYKRNSKEVPDPELTVKIPCRGISGMLAACWDFADVPVEAVRKGFDGQPTFDMIKKRIKSGFRAMRAAGPYAHARKNGKYLIACHYAEGFDPYKRNDLNWFEGSGVSPERVLIYFDNPDNNDGKPVRKEVIEGLRDAGFGLIALKEGIIEGGDCEVWAGPRGEKDVLQESEYADDPAEKWVCEKGNELIRSAGYWRAFYRDFNIRINYIPEEGMAKSFAQAIAFDMDGEAGGLLAGKQRSEAFLPYRYYLGHHPKHIFFMWSGRAAKRVNPDCERIDRIVVSGYPYDALKRHRSSGEKGPAGELRSAGATFVIALFDNMHGRDYYNSTVEIQDFYTVFFKWAMQDKKVGLILKSKKSLVIESLPGVQPLLNALIASGRCIKLDDELGRYPSDASYGADFAIGTGISTAVVESVLAGCKGIHYDLTRLKSYEYYDWGSDRIIFNDLEKMTGALKRYMLDPKSEPGLGDWTGHIEDLDTFHDWKGGARMGSYMKYLLESFDSGKDRNGAIGEADKKYSGIWGADKIIKMERSNG